MERLPSGRTDLPHGARTCRRAMDLRTPPDLPLDHPMAKEHRRELYSPASAAARQVPDASGPDGVRVTLRVEPAVDRLRRWRFMFFTPPVLTQPVDTYFRYRVLPDLVQKYLLRDRWIVDVESDSGERCRVRADTREQAIYYARHIHDGVQKQGITFLRSFAR
jgi:hypothetical protein